MTAVPAITRSDTGPGALPREIRVGDTLTVIIASQPPASGWEGRRQEWAPPSGPRGLPTGVYISTYSISRTSHGVETTRHKTTRYIDRRAAIHDMPWLEPLLWPAPGSTTKPTPQGASNG